MESSLWLIGTGQTDEEQVRIGCLRLIIPCTQYTGIELTGFRYGWETPW